MVLLNSEKEDKTEHLFLLTRLKLPLNVLNMLWKKV